MILENGPEGAQTVPLSDFMRNQLEQVYTDVNRAWEGSDTDALGTMEEFLARWVHTSPFPNVLAHALEYCRAAIATVYVPESARYAADLDERIATERDWASVPTPELIEAARRATNEVFDVTGVANVRTVADVRADIANRPKKENWIYE
jgi:hypothetical protein